MTDRVIPQTAHTAPTVFTQAMLGWVPWLEPLPESALTDRHRDGLVDPARAKNPYFMLLARDPEVLGARTRTDKDIFYNPEGGLPRAERELAAAAASRLPPQRLHLLRVRPFPIRVPVLETPRGRSTAP